MTPKPESSTTKKSQETRRNILEAAEAAFAANGFDGANMREIAAAAGVLKFMLYYHFENKEALFEQILERNFKPVFQQLTTILARESSLEEAVRDVYDTYADLFAAKGEHLRALMVREIAAGAPRVSKFFQLIAPQILGLWKPKIAAFVGQQHIPAQQIPLAIYSIMIGIVSNFLMYPIFSAVMKSQGLSLYDDEVKEHVIQFILGGLRDRLAQPA